MTCHNNNLIICHVSSSIGLSVSVSELLPVVSPCVAGIPQHLIASQLDCLLSGSGPQSKCYISEGSNFFTFSSPPFLTQPRKLCSITSATFCSLQEMQGERNQTLPLDGDSKEECGAIFLAQAVASYQKGVQARNIVATTSGKCYVLHVYNF